MTTTDARARWIAAATGTGPRASKLRADRDALYAELAVLAAAPAVHPTDGRGRSKPGSRAPRRTGQAASAATVERVLAEADSLCRALDDPPDDPRHAWWAGEGARMERAIQAARFDLAVARFGRGAPARRKAPWEWDGPDGPLAEPPDPPPAEADGERVRAGGTELRALRDAAGLTQEDVAEQIAPGADMTAASAQRVALARFEAGSGGLSRSVLDAAVAVCRSVRPLG